MFEPAARPMTLNKSGNWLTTSSVWVPIEPVEPKRAIFFMHYFIFARRTPSPKLQFLAGMNARASTLLPSIGVLFSHVNLKTIPRTLKSSEIYTTIVLKVLVLCEVVHFFMYILR